MSIKKNTIANYIGRLYITFIGIILLPIYYQYLGPAAFGLISLLTVMQSLLRLFDMGLTPTLSREVAYHRHQGNNFTEIKQLLHSLEIIFFVISIVMILIVSISSRWIVYVWLKVDHFSYYEVTYIMIVISGIICLRWFSDLYRAGMLGLERQVWCNSANIIILSIQYIGGYCLLRWVTRESLYFFEYQLFVAVIEIIVFRSKLYKNFPNALPGFLHFYVSWNSIKKVLPFASGLAYTSTLWILLTQLDKVLLSHILPLSTYGYFALVTSIAAGILQFSSPISQAILPRMTFLLSQGKEQEMLQLYRNATQVTAVIVLSLTGIMAMYSSELIYAWTGDKAAANWGGPIFFWYILGNGILSIAAFQYYLQFAYGKLKLHVMFNTLFALIAIPIICFVAYRYSAKGTAIAWFVMESISFLIWTPIIHHKLAPGIHLQWLMKDIFPIFFVILGTLFFIKNLSIDFELISRNISLIIFVGFTLVIFMAGSLASSTCRGFMVFLLFKWRRNITA